MQARQTIGDGGKKKEKNAIQTTLFYQGSPAKAAWQEKSRQGDTARQAKPAVERTLFYQGPVTGTGGQNPAAVPSAKEMEDIVVSRANGETALPSFGAEEEDGVNNWIDEYNQLISQAEADRDSRDGVWQDTSSFEDYRRRQSASIFRLQQQARRFRDFFGANRGIYGDRTVDSILEQLDKGSSVLGRLGDGLRAEGEFRGQFAGQKEFDDYTRVQGYGDLPGAPDFAEKSRYKSTYDPETEYFSRVDDTWYNTGYGDILYDYINRNEDAGYKYLSSRGQAALAGIGMADTQLQEMSDEEIGIFNYLYAQDEAKGDRKHTGAYQYIRDLNGTLNARQRQADQDAAARFAREHPYLADAASILASPMRGVSYLGQAVDYLTDREIDPNAGYNRYSYVPSAIRGQRSQDIANGWAGDAGSFLYGTAMSMGDFLTNAALTGGLAGGGKAAENLALGLMGAGAAADTVVDKLDQGYSDTRAFILGTVAGLAEVATEKFSLDKLLDRSKLGRSAFGYFIKNTVAEGSEEGASDLINWAADELYDLISGQSDSEWKRAVRAYKEEGMDDGRAVRAALLDKGKELGLDALGGILSGGVMATGGIAIDSAQNRSTGRAFNALGEDVIQATLQEGLDSPEGSLSYDLARRYQDKLDAGKALTNGEIGRLYRANVAQIKSEDATDQTAAGPAESESGTPAPGIRPTWDTDALLRQAAREMAEEESGQGDLERPSTIPSQASPDSPFQKGPEGQADHLRGAGDVTETEGNPIQQESPRQPEAGPLPFHKGVTSSPAGGAVGQSENERTLSGASHHLSQRERQGQAATLTQAPAAFGENGKKAFAAAWDGQEDSARYYAGFATWYQAGLTGKAQDQVRGPYAGNINEAQRLAAYSAGQNDAAASLARERAAARSTAVYTGKEAGFNPKTAPAGMDKRTVAYIDALGKATGTKIEMGPATGENGANGWYKNGVIGIAADAKDPGMVVATHEITHRMQELAPKEYRAFRDYAMNLMDDKAGGVELVEVYKERYAEAGQTLTTEGAMDEIAADFTGNLLRDVKGFKDLARAHRNVAQKLLDAVRDFVHKVKSAFKGNKAAQDSAATGAYGLSMNELEQAAKLWGEALEASRQTVEAAGQKNTTVQEDGGEARYSLGGKEFSEDKYFARQMDHWAELNDGARVKVGMVRKGSALQRVGLPTTEMYFDVGKIRKSMSDHGDHLTAEVLKGIPDLLNDPIVITEYTGPNGTVKNTVNVYGNLFANGHPVVVGVVMHLDRSGLNVINNIRTVHARTNFAKQITDDTVLYLNEGKKKVRSWFQVCGNLNVPLEGTKYGLIRSIAFDSGDVKGESEPRYSLKKTDSEGRTLSEGQREFFKDSKVVDEDGRLKVMYHGTPYGGFTTFRDGSYFTDSPDYAQMYQTPGSKRSPSQTEAPAIYRVYLNVKKPFDTRMPDARGIFYDEYYRQYGTGTDLQENGLPDWTDGDDLIEFLQENGYDYDGLILKEGGGRGISYVTFSPEQVKNVDNGEPTGDPDIRHSLKRARDIQAELSAIRQQNEDLKEKLAEYKGAAREAERQRGRADYWRGQTKQTTEPTTDKKAVAAAAKALVKEYGAELDAGELGARLQSLYDTMAAGRDGENELGPTAAWARAEEIARDIAGAAVEKWSLDQEFPGLKERLKTTRLAVGHEYDGDIRNENFRREYRGKLNLTAREGTNVDAVYNELAEDYPGLFPEDITHPAGQLEQIMDVADALYTTETQNPFSGQMEAAVAGITNEIVEGFFDLPQTRATMADRYEAKLDAARAHGKQRVQETRAQYQARMEKLREDNRQAVRRAIERERGTRQRQIKALQDRYAQSRKNAAGRRADSKARDRLLHIVRRLQNKKLPEVNRTLLNEYIGDLDTVAKSMTGQTLEKLTNLRDWYSEQKSNNPDFIADPKIERDLERLSKRQIGDLSAQEVADLTQALLNIENEIRTQRKLIDSQERRDVYAAGEAAIRDIEASAGSKPAGLWSAIDKGIVTETLSPLRQVRRMTGYAPDSPLTKVTQELADGQRAMMDYQMKAEAQFAKYTNDKGFAKSFAGPKAKGIQIQGLGRDGPVTVTITPAMRASLYLHSLNDQNLRHIRDGGITVPDWKLYQKGKIAEAYARGTTLKLTPSQVRSITANMTQKERAFAMAAHRYFNETSKEAVNAVSEKLKGYSIAQVEDYFPIRTDSSFTRADFESVKFDGTIEGMGFLKERVNAANPILLRDMSAELDQSIQLHSKYVGLAVPVRNFNKLWNVTTGQWVDGDSAMDYNGDEGGESYGQTGQLQGPAGDDLRGENYGADTGGAGENQGRTGKVAGWASKALIQAPGGAAGEAVKTARGYGVRAVVVQDAAIKARNPNAMALTEGGVVYISDALPADQAGAVGHHEAVHAVKQRGSAAYETLLSQEADRVDFSRGNAVMDLLLDSRFPGKDITSLDRAAMRTLFDELNALVWGCHMANQANAKEKFGRVFHDYDGLIGEMSRIMEQARQEGESHYGGERPAGNQSISGKVVRERTQNAAKYARTGGAMGAESSGAGRGAESAGVTSRRFEYTDSVKKAVNRKWGEAGYSYIEKMMSDLQNGHRPTKTWAKAMGKLRSNYAGAVLTLNASVAMKQAASYPTAAAVLGWGPLARAIGDVGKVDLNLIAKYTPLQWYRSKGFSTQELGDMKSANRQLPKVLNWVQGVDLITTRKLWKASEYYVRGRYKGLNPGTDAYYRAVADIYNQVIEETQPNYTTMQRPQLLRSEDSLLANLQMFKTQPFQNFNIVYDAVGELTAAMRRGDKAQIKAARAKTGRAVTSQLAQLGVFAGMTMAWALLRGKKKKYEDEDGELTTQSMLTALGKDMAGGALAGIPFGSDAWELLSSKLFGDSYYGMDAVTVQALSDTIQSMDGIGNLIGNIVRTTSAGEAVDWRSTGIKLDGYLDDISKAAGVPYENVANLIHAIYRQVCIASLGELQGEYAAMKLTVDPTTKGKEYYDLLYKALERGDVDSYWTIRDDLPELLDRDNNELDDAMKDRYRARVKEDPDYTLPQGSYDLLGIRPQSTGGEEKEDTFGPEDLDSAAYQAYASQRAEEYRQAEEALGGSPIFKGMDQATRDKVLQAAYDLAESEALRENGDGLYKYPSEWLAQAPEAEKQGIEAWEYALWQAVKNSTEATKDGAGKVVKGEAISDKLMDWLNNKSGLTENQQKFLWYTKYTKDFDEYRDDLAEYRSYGPQMDQAYSEITGGLEDNPIFEGMDAETREKVMSAAREAAKQTAQAEAIDGYEYENQWVAKSEEAEAQGISSSDYVMWHVVSENAKSDYDAAGNPIKGQEKKDKVRAWLKDNDSLTYDQKLWLWHTKYSVKTPF